jgi:phytoene/squalene synthetase
MSLEQSFIYCSRFTRKRSWKLWLMTQIMMNPENRGYIYLCHTYFRWLDDYIDDINRDAKDKEQFIEAQIKLFEQLKQQKKVETALNEETFLYYLVKHAAEKNNRLLIETMCNLMEGMLWDVNRSEGRIIYTETKLKQYIALQSQTFSTTIHLFLKPDFDASYKKVYIGEFYWYVLTLRDFMDDIASNYINISIEDMQRFGIDKHDILNDPNRYKWMEYKYPYIMQILENENNLLKTYPLKLKLFWVPGYVTLLIELVRIKEYDYKFGVAIKQKLGKEITLFFEVGYIYLKFVASIFLPINFHRQS